MVDHHPSDLELSDVDAIRILLGSIDNALRTGSYMTNANLALEILCDRLGVDRRTLTFDARRVSDLLSALLEPLPEDPAAEPAAGS